MTQDDYIDLIDFSDSIKLNMTLNDIEWLRGTHNDWRWPLARSCEPEKPKNAKKVKRGKTDQPANQLTKRGVLSRSTRLISMVLRKQMEIHFCTRHWSAPSHIKDRLGLSFRLSVALRLSVGHNLAHLNRNKAKKRKLRFSCMAA